MHWEYCRKITHKSEKDSFPIITKKRSFMAFDERCSKWSEKKRGTYELEALEEACGTDKVGDSERKSPLPEGGFMLPFSLLI